MKDGMIYRYQKLDSAWMKDGDHTMDKEEQVYYAEEEGVTKIFSGSIVMDNDNNTERHADVRFPIYQC